MKKYYLVKFDNSGDFVLFYNGKEITTCLTFTEFVYYIEERNIDFKSIKLHCNFDDLFKNIVTYSSFYSNLKNLKNGYKYITNFNVIEHKKFYK